MKVASKARRPVFLDFNAQDTRRNLPQAVSTRRIESRFLRSFEDAYFAAEVGVNLAGREFALEGFGRADLVWLAWERQQATDEFTALALKKRVCLTAIEGKISDWRKGLQQSFRYRYFAHRSLLVLPLEPARTAANYLPTFRRLRVGLWGFDSKTGTVRKWCTPRPSPPLNRKALEKALHLFELSLNLRKLAKGR